MLSERAEKWRQEWVQEGVLSGEMKGRYSLLEKLLRKRFGSELTDKHLSLLHEATPDQLDAWGEKILDAETIQDVFSE